MRIIQVLNNNVAIVKNDHNEQAIVMGLGIAFKKKKGDLVITSKIEKSFYLKNEESQENFSILLKDVPLDIITLSYDLINQVVQKFNYSVQEYVYVTLTDHIYASYQAVLQQTYLESDLPDLSQSYPLEFEIGQFSVAFLERELSIQLPSEEVGRLALHFINAKAVSDSKLDLRSSFKSELITLVKRELESYGIKRGLDNRNFYDRLMVHLNYFCDRIDDGVHDNDSMVSLDDNLKQSYPKSYQIAKAICTLFEENFGYHLNTNEHIYLVIHIQRLLQVEN